MKQYLFFALALCCSWPLMAQELYRYTNEQGQTVMASDIPAQYVSGGYDVLDARGQLVRRVPPQAPDQAADSANAMQITESSAEDEMLLASYSSVEEIEAHLQRKLEAIEREISIIQTDQRVMGDEFTEVDAEYASLVEREREVPPDLVQNREDIRSTLAFLEQQLDRRRQEMEHTRHEFDARIARFRQLSDQR